MSKPERALDPMDFQIRYNHIAPADLDDFLDSLEVHGLLSEAGKSFRLDFWETFIKQDENS